MPGCGKFLATRKILGNTENSWQISGSFTEYKQNNPNKVESEESTIKGLKG